MTGVTLGALLRLTKPEEPNMKQVVENAQEGCDINMEEEVFLNFYLNPFIKFVHTKWD